MTTKRLLTNTALSALLGAMPTILAVLASVAGVSACACGRKNIEWNLIDEKNRQHDLSKDGKESRLVEHDGRPPKERDAILLLG
jgi:hypothetical protein